MMEKNEMRNLQEVLRDEMLMHRLIYDLLKAKPMTIPELAQTLDMPSWEITAWIMSMRRYGLIKELPKGRADDYFQYTILSEEQA
jgi:predicted Rossmann fold nucleotide-binding protein DprA/Smf involved in DNA uptake